MHPELNLFGLIIPSYSFFVALGFLIGMIYADKISKYFGISENRSFIIMCNVELGVILGGKLLYMIINLKYLPQYYSRFGFIGLFSKTGFVFYGGLIGAVFLIYLYSKLARMSFQVVLSFVMAVAPLIHSIGRVGCFFAGCCYGISWDGIFSVFLHGEYRFPVQLLESIFNLLLALGLFFIVKTGNKYKICYYYLIGYGVIRLITEQLRGDISRGFIYQLSISSFISIISITIGMIGIIFFQRRKNESIKEN